MSVSKDQENHLKLTDIPVTPFTLESVQQDIFIDTPIDIVTFIDFQSGTVQASRIALAKDGGEYVVKSINDGSDDDIRDIENMVDHKILKEMSPVSELFCYKIASLCGLPTPQYRILIDSENNLYFGSSIDQGHSAKDINDLVELFFTPTGVVDIFFMQLWTIYAFDCFFFNIDRHMRNYLILKGQHFNYTQIKPFDFGFSSFSFIGYPYDEPYISETNCKTKQVMKLIDTQLKQNNEQYRQKRATYIEVAKKQLDELLKINLSKIKEIMYSIPEQWMSKAEKDKFINWWNSEEKVNRIRKIKTMELV